MIPFLAAHFWAIDVQPAQAYVRRYVSGQLLADMERTNAFTCVVGERPVACFGWVEHYPTRAALWAFISGTAGRHFVAITRIAKRLIAGLPHKRIEIEVDYEFEQGHRWAKMLGFEVEAPRMRGFRIDGGDSALYAKVR